MNAHINASLDYSHVNIIIERCFAGDKFRHIGGITGSIMGFRLHRALGSAASGLLLDGVRNSMALPHGRDFRILAGSLSFAAGIRRALPQ